MAAGGQGAPLVPYVDWALFTHDKHPRILQNIGGIGNLTFLPPRATLTEVMAFDTGPGNMVIDAVVQKLSRGRMAYDRNGLWARKGSVSAPLLELLMKHPFLRLPPPKSTGREEFGQPFMDQLLRSARRLRLADADIVATATAFTASSISQACKRYVFTKLGKKQLGRVQMIVGGGGARNLTLMKMIGEAIAPATVLTHEDLGGSSVAKEAIAFAVLAHETLQGKPSNVPSATGAKRPVILGKIVPAGRVGLQ
jgi:anhydro-N-acetylmuramic acid kinase